MLFISKISVSDSCLACIVADAVEWSRGEPTRPPHRNRRKPRRHWAHPNPGTATLSIWRRAWLFFTTLIRTFSKSRACWPSTLQYAIGIVDRVVFLFQHFWALLFFLEGVPLNSPFAKFARVFSIVFYNFNESSISISWRFASFLVSTKTTRKYSCANATVISRLVASVFCGIRHAFRYVSTSHIYYNK